MLGANVGTTLIVQVLSFNIAAIAPVLFIFGLVAFRGGARSRIKDIGRVFIGLGLMLLALHVLLTLPHELGHFAAARFLGVLVPEFGIGLPPTIGAVRWRGKGVGTPAVVCGCSPAAQALS